VRDLEIARIPRDDISMVARNLDNRVADPDASNAGAGAAAGASIGGVLGGGAGLLAGLGMLAIPASVRSLLPAGWWQLRPAPAPALRPAASSAR
jgi:hypothetical protein